MFSSSSFDHTAPSLRTSQILGHKRQRCHPPSTDFGLSWLLLPLVKPVLVRSSARSNEDTTSRFLSKNHTNPISTHHMDTNRLSKELREIASDKASGVSVELVGDSLAHMRGTITGPSETPYQGGTFLVDIHITNSYPFEPPKMKFLTKWTPALTIKTALLSVQALLAAAEPDDPQDAVVAKMYVSNRAQFDLQAKEWTEKYAKEGQKVEAAKDPKVVKLMEMGFGEQDAERALVKCNFNQEEALEYLLAQ
ncbi:unnamed protein product [Bathycoccus prasinos]